MSRPERMRGPTGGQIGDGARQQAMSDFPRPQAPLSNVVGFGHGVQWWDITGGSIGDQLRLDAERAGQGSRASTITVVGQFQNPPSYRGTYGFEGSPSSVNHTTLYQV